MSRPTDPYPLGIDAAITESMTQRRFRLLLTLAGAASGLYLAITGGQHVIYLGPLVGVAGWYSFIGPLWRVARRYGSHWEPVEWHEPPYLDSDD